MKCPEAISLIAAGRDDTRGARDYSQLEAHLAECGACRRIRDDLAAGLESWRAGTRQAAAPDPGREWLAVRRRMRGAATPGDETSGRTHHAAFFRFAIPLGAAAAIALALFSPWQVRDDPATAAAGPAIARADSVEIAGSHASTTVFVDDKSGWLIVWASDAVADGG